jgi:hypothetical protein
LVTVQDSGSFQIVYLLDSIPELARHFVQPAGVSFVDRETTVDNLERCYFFFSKAVLSSIHLALCAVKSVLGESAGGGVGEPKGMGRVSGTSDVRAKSEEHVCLQKLRLRHLGMSGAELPGH